MDFERYGVVNEVLLISGAELPGSRQVPLLDSHRRFDSASVIGSIRNLLPNSDMILGDAIFSTAPETESIWTKVREGHLTDFSAGYRVIDGLWIPAGETAKVNGRTYEGPLKIAKKWQLKEVSTVPIGADEMATARAEQRADNNNLNQNSDMGGKNKMPEKAEIFSKTEIIQQERERTAEISAMCNRYGVPGDVLTQLIDRGETVADAKIVVGDFIMRRELAKDNMRHFPPYDDRQGGLSGAYITHDATEKREAAAVDGLCLRAGTRIEKPAPGADEYRVMSLVDVAKDCLEASGTNTRGMTRDGIIRQALSQRAATTGDFTSILAGTSNKILRSAYEASPATWKVWCNKTTGADFKEMSRNQLSAGPALDEIPEHGEYTYGKFSDSQEVFSIVKYGKLFAITRESLVNDDLGAFTRIPASFGQSAARRVNAAAYAALTANANMADGYALFAAEHSNFVASGSGAAPSETTLNAARVAMRGQTGLAGEVLNIAPAFLICPAALETTVDKILNSFGDLADNKSSGVINPFYKKLEPVVEALLDASSATGWYLSASPSQVDTVEVCFLNGQEFPFIDTKEGWTVDGTEFKCRIEFGVKSIDYRSLYFNFGA